MDEVLVLLRMGMARRRIAPTAANAHSSRSHALFAARIQAEQPKESGIIAVRTSRLTLVDLAGEHNLVGWPPRSQKMSGAMGGRDEATAALTV